MALDTTDDYSTPWLNGSPDSFLGGSADPMGAGINGPIFTSGPTDTVPVSSPGGGGINEAAPAMDGGGSPWLPNAPQAPASAPGTQPAASANPSAQNELDLHQMAANLTADGHDVSWNAQGQMVVDGRTYDVQNPEGGTPSESPSGGGGAPGNTEPNVPAVGGDMNYQVASLYNKYLGPGEGLKPERQAQVAAWANSGKDIGFIENAIANSKEAMDYAVAHGFGAPTAGNSPGAAGGRRGTGASALDMSVPQWLRDMVPGYTPTLMDTTLSELPDFKTLYDSASGRNPNQQALDALVGKVLEHPESLDERAIQTLKGRAAEEAAVAAQANDEDLLHFAASSNLNDSPWLASARQANSQARRNTTIQANQNLDVAAADRTAADRRSAAQLGITAQNATSARSQAATSVAMSGVLAKVGLQTTRAQMNEAFKQAATTLGLSTAALASNYVLGHAGIQIDEKKLKAQSEQWQQELALNIARLKQQSDQYDADLQLRLQDFQHRKDNDAWTQAQAAYAA